MTMVFLVVNAQEFTKTTNPLWLIEVKTPLILGKIGKTQSNISFEDKSISDYQSVRAEKDKRILAL